MVVLEWITAVILIIAFLMSGGMKLMNHPMAEETSERLGYQNLQRPIGIAEVLAAIGVLLGAAISGLEWLGVLAGIGIVLLMIGALTYHRRAGDGPQIMAVPAGLGVIALLYIIALFGN